MSYGGGSGGGSGGVFPQVFLLRICGGLEEMCEGFLNPDWGPKDLSKSLLVLGSCRFLEWFVFLLYPKNPKRLCFEDPFIASTDDDKNGNHEHVSKNPEHDLRKVSWRNFPKKKLDNETTEASTKPVHHGKLPNRLICRTPSFGFGSAGRDGAVASWVTTWGDVIQFAGFFGAKKLHLNNFQTPTVSVDSAGFFCWFWVSEDSKKVKTICVRSWIFVVLSSRVCWWVRCVFESWGFGVFFCSCYFFEYTKAYAGRWFRHLADDSTVNRNRDIYAWFHHIKWIATAKFLNHQEYHGENPWLFAVVIPFSMLVSIFLWNFHPDPWGDDQPPTEIRTQQLKQKGASNTCGETRRKHVLQRLEK